MGDREAVGFVSNVSVEVSLEDTSPRENSLGNWTYFLTNQRIMHVPKVCSVLIGNLDPQPGECFYITKHVQRMGKKTQTEWLVTAEPPIIAHAPAPNGTVSDIAGAVAATGIAETQLERQLRESAERKALQQAAADRIRAKIALEKRGDAVADPPSPEMPAAAVTLTDDDLPPTPGYEPIRKPVAVETVSQPTPPPPVAPEPPKAPERYIWFPNLVEVTRSYTFKLNVGNYESRDFFCSQKAECRPEDADLVSEKLYEFCKRQVMKAVEMESKSRRLA